MTKPSVEIWDAVPADVDACLALPHESKTQRVWQAGVRQDGEAWNIQLRESDLSREMTLNYAKNPIRLQRALGPEHCFLVAVEPDDETILGYLVMLTDPDQPTATLQDLVVTTARRRQGIGLRLVSVARKWAKERDLKRVLAVAQTKNYPAIALYQKAGYSFCGYHEQYFENRDIAVFFCQMLRK